MQYFDACLPAWEPSSALKRQAGGIRSLRERALTVDARLHVQRAVSGGTEVLLWVPAGQGED